MRIINQYDEPIVSPDLRDAIIAAHERGETKLEYGVWRIEITAVGDSPPEIYVKMNRK